VRMTTNAVSKTRVRKRRRCCGMLVPVVPL
jgi:hypothetical protein